MTGTSGLSPGWLSPARVRRHFHRSDRVTTTTTAAIVPANHLAARYVTFDRGDADGSHACFAATLTVNVALAYGAAPQCSARSPRSRTSSGTSPAASPQPLTRQREATRTHHRPVGHVRLGRGAAAGCRSPTRARRSTPRTFAGLQLDHGRPEHPPRPARRPRRLLTSIWGTTGAGAVGRRCPDHRRVRPRAPPGVGDVAGRSGSSSTRAATDRCSATHRLHARSDRAPSAPATTTVRFTRPGQRAHRRSGARQRRRTSSR